MKGCQVYSQDNAIYIVSMANTQSFSFSTDPMFKVNKDDPLSTIGKAVLTALDSFQEIAPVPNVLQDNIKKLIKFLGHKSWKQVEKNMVHFGVSCDEKKVCITPTCVAPDRGYEPLLGKAVYCNLEADTIGRTLVSLLSTKAS